MAQKTDADETNVVRVLKSVEAVLLTLNFDHPDLDFFTEGALVEMGRDPRHVVQDRVAEYDRLNVALTVMPGDTQETDKRTGGVRRYKYTYVLCALATLTPDDMSAGVTLVQKQERIVSDCRQLLNLDDYIKAQAVILGFSQNPTNGQRMSMINHRITNVVSDNGNAHPSINFDMICEFDFDISQRAS